MWKKRRKMKQKVKEEKYALKMFQKRYYGNDEMILEFSNNFIKNYINILMNGAIQTNKL